MNLRRERDYNVAMFAPQQPYYFVRETPTEPLGSFHNFPSLPDEQDAHLDESHYYDNQMKYYFVSEHPYEKLAGFGSDQQVVYVVQEEPPITEADAKEYELYASIAGKYLQNKGKSAAGLQADIDYLKKLRQRFPIAKDFLTRMIQKKRDLKKVLDEQAQQESLRDYGYTGIVAASLVLIGALTIYTLKK